jgi:hypothetical protein
MRTVERRNLVDDVVEELFPTIANVVSFFLLDAFARNRFDELIAAHADVTVQTPNREHDVVLPEGPVPAQGVLVIRVDERPVDIENGG